MGRSIQSVQYKKDLLSMPVRHMRAYGTEASAVLCGSRFRPERVARGAWAECDSTGLVPTDSEPRTGSRCAVVRPDWVQDCAHGGWYRASRSSSTDPSRCRGVPTTRASAQ